jgi:hypothetical protein
MAIKRQSCTHHPERVAIGVCVMTERPICAECSTRYEGVNYSKEGLALLMERRREEASREGRSKPALATLLYATSPLLIYTIYYFYRVTLELCIDLQQFTMETL